jgi:lysozyme
MFQSIKNFITSILSPKHRAQGIDGSHWWGVFNPAAATKPIDFIILKATEGTTWIDPSLIANYEGAKFIPVRGMYHYQRANMSWLRQAEHFLSVTDKYDNHILALDVEKINNEPAFNPLDHAESNTFFSDMRRIIDYWRMKAPEKTVVLYTNPDIYWNHIVPAIRRVYGLGGMEWLDEIPKWIAVYNGQNQDGEPTSRYGIPEWMFWQYSSNGKKEEYGTQGDVDQNVYNGTVEEMQKRIIGHELPPPPPPPPVEIPPAEPEPLPETWSGTVVSITRLIVRKYPEVSPLTDTGQRLVHNERISGKVWAGNGYLWMKLDGNAPESIKGKWVAVRKPDGDRFIRLDPRSLPPPIETPKGLATVVWDDQNPDYGYKCRTQSPHFTGPDNPPAINRYWPRPINEMGDFRVDLAIPHNWEPAIVEVNGGNRRKFFYLTGRKRAMYNNGQKGWPKQMYLVMSGNKLQGELLILPDEKTGRPMQWFKFKTLKPADLAKVKGWTNATHPQFIHRFTCVTWDKKTKTTRRINSTGTPRGDVFYYLVTVEGEAYIPGKHVVFED